jgi:CBS domain containing-hemolysin-like protein
LETSEQKDAKKKPKKKGKQEKSTGRWAVQVFFIAVILSAVLSFASDQALDGAGIGVAFAVLLAFILLGIVFDIIGVSVTAADEKPFHSMAARKTPGAREAIGLIRKADKVSSFCNDVVGDICGIISGSTGAVIVTQLYASFGLPSIAMSLAVTALTSGLTIGGKALGKSFAIAKSTAVLQLVGRILHIFSRSKK